MRKLVTAVAFGLFAMVAHAEASFDQIESLIQQKNYAAAEAGLEVIVKNHPQSAKAFYAMAQAQAGLGNLEKAQKALNIATGLNPTLDFAPEGSVRKLKEAITPQTAKIEQIEVSHFWRDFGIGFIIFAGGGLIILLVIQKKRKEEEAELSEKLAAQAARQEREEEARRMTREREESSKSAKSKKTTFTPVTSSALAKDTTPTASIATSGPAVQQPLYTPQPTHTTTVVNNGSNNDLLTTMVVMDMLSDHHHHDTTRVVEREVIREVPAKSTSRDSSWDDTTIREERSSSRSSSWDTPSTSSSRSSSWDSDSSSSSSSSSWSSSSSDSSSSWDSGSSSSDSSSSWD